MSPVSLIGDDFHNELAFGFSGEGKTGAPGERPLRAEKINNNKLHLHNNGVEAETQTQATLIGGNCSILPDKKLPK